MIYFTSDLHFCHDREFLYKPRGFNNVEDMNNAIVQRWNNVVKQDDDVYILGDLMLKDNERGCKFVESLNGKLHIVFGNHDTDNRIVLYSGLSNVVEAAHAIRLRWNGYSFFLTHYPCLCGSLEKDAKHNIINLFGHTHSKELFYEDRPYMYNVALDAHNCTPVDIHRVLDDIDRKYLECMAML